MGTTLNALICSTAWFVDYQMQLLFQIKIHSIFVNIWNFFLISPLIPEGFFPSFLLNGFYEAELKFKNSAIILS